MHINKDLAEAVMMLSCIILVLIGTTEFDNETNKTIIMAILGCLAVVMGLFRFFGKSKKENEHNETYS